MSAAATFAGSNSSPRDRLRPLSYLPQFDRKIRIVPCSGSIMSHNTHSVRTRFQQSEPCAHGSFCRANKRDPAGYWRRLERKNRLLALKLERKEP